MNVTLLISLQQITYLPYCAMIIAMTVVERRNPILIESSADKLLLVSCISTS